MISASAIRLYDKGEPVKLEVVVKCMWLEHRKAVAEALSGDALSEFTWAAKNRREFMDWLEHKRASGTPVLSDIYARFQLHNLMT